MYAQAVILLDTALFFLININSLYRNVRMQIKNNIFVAGKQNIR